MQIGEVSCLPWPIIAGQRRERERRALMVEVGGSVWSLLEICWKIGKDWNFWKLEILWLVKEGKEIRKKEKRKRIYKREDIFSILKNENIEKTKSRV